MTEQIDGFRQLLGDILTVSATLVAQQQNEEMRMLSEASIDQNEEFKKISAWAAILFAHSDRHRLWDELRPHARAALPAGLVNLTLYTVFRRRRRI